MKSWVKFGLIWGVFMFIMINIIFPLFDGETKSLKEMLVSLLLWLPGGLLFGYLSRNKKPQEK